MRSSSLFIKIVIKGEIMKKLDELIEVFGKLPGIGKKSAMRIAFDILEKNEIEITRLVVYPYSVSFNVLHEMKKNFKNLRGNKELKLIERY